MDVFGILQRNQGGRRECGRFSAVTKNERAAKRHGEECVDSANVEQLIPKMCFTGGSTCEAYLMTRAFRAKLMALHEQSVSLHQLSRQFHIARPVLSRR